MAGLYLGAAALVVPGLASVRKGAEQLWPAAPGGPVFDDFTIHAWDPDGGANSSGIITDAVGSAPLRAVNDTTPIANWNGEVANDNTVLMADSADLSTFQGLSQATLTFWVLRRAAAGNFAALAAYGDGAVDNSSGSNGTWEVRRDGASTIQMRIRNGGNTSAASGSFTLPEDDWAMLAIRLGASQWRTMINGSAALASLSWASQAKTNLSRGLAFGRYAPTPAAHGDGAGTTQFRGRFGDIRVHNKTLSNAEIDAIYSAGRQSY